MKYDVILIALQVIIQFQTLVFVLYFMMKNMENNRKIKIEIRKKQTMDFCFNDKENYEYLLSFAEKVVLKKSIDNKTTIAVGDKEMLLVLDKFEKIAIALKNNVYDENIISEYYGKYFVHFYLALRFFILDLRDTSKNSDLFLEYEKLARKWDERLSLSERRGRV